MSQSLVNIESRKKSLHYFFEKVVKPLGFKFTPDDELMNFLLEQEVIPEGKHGIPFRPCQPLRNDRVRDMQIVCPCIPLHRKHFDEIPQPFLGKYLQNIGMLMKHVRTESIHSYTAEPVDGLVQIKL